MWYILECRNAGNEFSTTASLFGWCKIWLAQRIIIFRMHHLFKFPPLFDSPPELCPSFPLHSNTFKRPHNHLTVSMHNWMHYIQTNEDITVIFVVAIEYAMMMTMLMTLSTIIFYLQKKWYPKSAYENEPTYSICGCEISDNHYHWSTATNLNGHNIRI